MTNGNTSIQFLGHSSFRITTPEGKIIFIDPWFTNNDFMPSELKEQEKADLVLISHGHDDHFDPGIGEFISKTRAKLIANPICRWFMIEKGMDQELIEPMNLGGSLEIFNLRITMVYAQHISHINLTDTLSSHPHASVGFIIRMSDGITIYYAGDTAVFGDMRLIADLYHPTIAILPIGDRYTMGPFEAAHAIRLLNVFHVIPCHFGTYPSLTGKPSDLIEFTSDIGGLEIHVLDAGESLEPGVD